MTWSYSGNPASSDKDLYRFRIGDTVATDPVLSDEEILFVLTESTNQNIRLYKLYTAASDRFARSFKRSLGPEAEDPTSRQKYFTDQMLYYRKLAAASGISTITTNSDSFRKGMNDNPLADNGWSDLTRA
jgi:triphosphoribosyl-dephospho-CoA synthetase